MTDLVPADQIEQLVGARRHTQAHLGRADSAEQTVYILHSAECKATGVDLRSCVYSRALDRGIDGLPDWNDYEDQVVTLQVSHGWLLPDDDGPDDIEHLRHDPLSCPPDGGCGGCGNWPEHCVCPPGEPS